MKYSVLLSILATGVNFAKASSCDYSGGNYYCDEVDAVVYSGIGYSGSYSDVTSMDESACTCDSETVSFSGTMSPLDEELSVHFRGPLKLLQFGVYYPTSSSSSKKLLKRDDAEEECTTTQHIHHNHKRAVKYVEVTETVYVDQNGNLITSTATATSTSQDGATTTATSSTETVVSTFKSSSSSSGAAESTTTTSSSSDSTSTSSSGDWERVAYWEPNSKTNITFLNTLGGVNDSGTWSSCFGNSLSYCAADGSSASSESVALGEVTIESDTEFIIFSGSSCDDTDVGDCGYYRSDIPAYHGFGGAEKIFVFEFTMPTESTADSSTTDYDMPAIWLLNAKIPRTLQYGDSSCSCWSTGCGELDLFEILTAGESRLISHLHDGEGDDGTSTGGGGSSDYFARPTDSSMKAAAVFEDGEVHIVVLDDDVDFGSTLSSSTVEDWESVTGGTAAISD